MLQIVSSDHVSTENMHCIYLPSPIGVLQLVGNKLGEITVLHFCNDPYPLPTPDYQIPPSLKPLCDQLKAYFNGEKISFQGILAPKGTPFQHRLWQQLCQITYGQTQTYKQIARRLGDVKTIRAAAHANGQNPIAILIPCHRVIGTNGSLVGYAGGLWRKQFLLELEQRNPRLF